MSGTTKKEDKYQQKLRSLTIELIRTEERERKKIASELHDGIGQSLALVKIKLNVLKKTLKRTKHFSEIEEISEIIEKIIQDSRSLVFELSPPILHKLGLIPTIQWLTERFQSEYRLAIRFDVDETLNNGMLSDTISTLLFRITKELLINIIKHANAGNAFIRLSTDGNVVELMVEDDGSGISSECVEFPAFQFSGFGLFSIWEQIRALKGQMNVKSKPESGTKVKVTLPVEEFP